MLLSTASFMSWPIFDDCERQTAQLSMRKDMVRL